MKKYLEDMEILLLVAIVILVLAAGNIAYNKWAYNDWTCVFKQCVQVSK